MAASAWSRAATSSAAVPNTSSTWRWRRISASAEPRTLQFRLDVFNVFNTLIYNDRVTTVQYRSPTDQTIVNSQYLPDGTLDPNRLTPRNAGFGAATSAQPLRNMQLQIRFGF